MKKSFFIISLFVLIVLNFCLNAAAPVQKQEPLSPLATVTSNKDYAAIVNGEKITLEEFNASLKSAQQTLLLRDHLDFETEEGEFVLATTKKSIIDDMINNRLINQQSQKMNITVSEEDIKERIAGLKKGFPSHQAFVDTLLEEGISEEDLRQGMKEQTVIQKIKRELTQKVVVSDKELDRFIKHNSEFAYGKKQYHLAQIITATEEEGKQILKKIGAGEPFDKLAIKYSIDIDSRDSGGNIGFVEEGILTEEADAAVKLLTAGKVTPLVLTNDGYVIYKCLGIIDPQKDGVEQRKEDAVKFLKAKKENELFEKWFKKIRSEANIELNNDVIPLLPENLREENHTIPGSTLSNAQA